MICSALQKRCNENHFRLTTILGLKLFLKMTQYQRLKTKTKQTWAEKLSRMLFICQYGNIYKPRTHILVFFVHNTHQRKGHCLLLENQSSSVSLEEASYRNTTAAGVSYSIRNVRKVVWEGVKPDWTTKMPNQLGQEPNPSQNYNRHLICFQLVVREDESF